MYVSQEDFWYHRLTGKGEHFQKRAQSLWAKSVCTYRPKVLQRVSCKSSALHSLDHPQPERDWGCRSQQHPCIWALATGSPTGSESGLLQLYYALLRDSNIMSGSRPSRLLTSCSCSWPRSLGRPIFSKYEKDGAGTAWSFPGIILTFGSGAACTRQPVGSCRVTQTPSFSALLDGQSTKMSWSLSGQRQQTAQRSWENSPTRSPLRKLLWPFHLDFSIPVSRSENPGRARGAVTPSQVQHCRQRARKKWVREGHLWGLLCTLGQRSWFPAVSGLGGPQL